MRLSVLFLFGAACFAQEAHGVEHAERLLQGGHADEARVLFRGLVEKPGAAPPERVRARVGFALALAATGFVESAWEQHDLAASEWAGVDKASPAACAAALLQFGEFLKRQGRFVEARGRFEEGVAAARADPEDRLRVAEGIASLAYCLDALGRTEQGAKLIGQALEACRGETPRARAVRARVLNVAGILFSVRGEELRAVAAFGQGLRLLAKNRDKDHPDVARLLHNLSFSQLWSEHNEEASATAARAFEMNRRIYGAESIEVAMDWSSRGIFFLLEEDSRAARRAFDKALAIARRLRHPYVHLFATSAGLASEREGQRKEAIEYYEEAVAEIEMLRWRARGLPRDERVARFLHLRRARPYLRLARLHLRHNPSEAVRWIERSRAREVLDLLARSRFDPLLEAERRAREQGDENRLARIGEIRAELTAARAELAQASGTRSSLEARIRAHDRRRRAERMRASLVSDLVPIARPADTMELQRNLGPKERLLFYMLEPEADALTGLKGLATRPALDGPAPGGAGPRPVGPQVRRHRGYVISVPPQGRRIRFYVLRKQDGWPAGAATIRQLTRAHLSALAGVGAPGRGVQPANSASQRGSGRLDTKLYKALVPDGLQAELKGVSRIHVVRHDALNGLPFESLLVDSAKRRFWIDQGPAVAYVPSGSVLLWCKQRRDKQRGRRSKHAVLALGDCRFGDAALSPLPGTRRELEAIEQSLGKKERATGIFLRKEDATEAKLFELAPRARVLHIATHQVFKTAGTSFDARLALTAPARPSSGDDGYLGLREMLETWRDRLSRCELVILSACETVRGQGEEGLFAMPLGFLYAGCPAVVGSLWRVDDDSTAAFFGSFYRARRMGKRTLDALAAARRDVRRKYPAPYHWAPFVCIGSPP